MEMLKSNANASPMSTAARMLTSHNTQDASDRAGSCSNMRRMIQTGQDLAGTRADESAESKMTVAQFGCLAVLLGAAAMGLAQGQSTQGQASTGSDPQIVRVSYVQGDVRISRGKEAEKLSHSDWEKAAVDLPIETGYS